MGHSDVVDEQPVTLPIRTVAVEAQVVRPGCERRKRMGASFGQVSHLTVGIRDTQIVTFLFQSNVSLASRIRHFFVI